MYVRVRDGAGHEFSTPDHDPLIGKGLLKVVGRKAATHVPLPPKHKKNLSPAGDSPSEADTGPVPEEG